MSYNDELRKDTINHIRDAGEYILKNAENFVPENVDSEYMNINIKINPGFYPEISVKTGHIPTRTIDRMCDYYKRTRCLEKED